MVLRKWESRSSPPKKSKARANARALFVISRRPGSTASAAGIVLIVIIDTIVIIDIIDYKNRYNRGVMNEPKDDLKVLRKQKPWRDAYYYLKADTLYQMTYSFCQRFRSRAFSGNWQLSPRLCDLFLLL